MQNRLPDHSCQPGGPITYADVQRLRLMAVEAGQAIEMIETGLGQMLEPLRRPFPSGLMMPSEQVGRMLSEIADAMTQGRETIVAARIMFAAVAERLTAMEGRN